MDPAPRAPTSSTRSSARIAKPRHKLALVVLLVGVAFILLGWSITTRRRSESTQVGREREGVLLAQRRAGEISPRANAPIAPSRPPVSTLPASPTPLPMPETPHANPKSNPRYLVLDTDPPRPAPGHLFVDTQPQASVWIDGEAKGLTPLDVTVGPGGKLLRLEAAGFRPVREIFEASQGASIRRALVPLEAPP